MRLVFAFLLTLPLSLVSRSALAQTTDADWLVQSKPPASTPWAIEWGSNAAVLRTSNTGTRLSFPSFADQAGDAQPLHRAAIQHSDAYLMRAKVHKYASFATLPLFATELALGQSVYDGNTQNKGAHAAVGASIVGLFAVNTVTGAWNMFGSEGRQEHDGRTIRLVHGLLMMAADIGFLATTATAPGEEGHGDVSNSSQQDKNLHRNLAIASISVGTAGYLVMLLGHH